MAYCEVIQRECPYATLFDDVARKCAVAASIVVEAAQGDN